LQENAIKFLRCVNCSNFLDFEIFSNDSSEGMLYCGNCHSNYPVINGIPILWTDFTKFLEHRKMLAIHLADLSQNSKMKSFVKETLHRIQNPTNELFLLEQKWVKIYQYSQNSEFYETIKNEINNIPSSNTCIEYGCSIGILSKTLSNHYSQVFGIDKSFLAIQHASQSSPSNVNYVVSDILLNPFSKMNFDFVVALNILELVEPLNLIDLISSQLENGFLLLTDPYDYDRGPKTVSKPLDEVTLRSTLEKCGFNLLESTKTPSSIPWNLQINPRTRLNYLCDMIIAKKQTID